MPNTTFKHCWLILASVIFSLQAKADIKQDINLFADQASSAAQSFISQTIKLRLRYEYRGFISDSQSQNLRGIAKKTSDQLDDIFQKQLRIKNRIENYSGEDWDRRYGDSGVWDTIRIDIFNTKILKAQIYYYSAFAARGKIENGRILNQALGELAGLPETMQIDLIKADIYSMLGKYDESSKKLAGELYRKILSLDKVPDEIYFPAVIGEQKLDPPLSPKVLDELAAKLEKSSCNNDFELFMKLAVLQKKLGSSTLLQKASAKWPQAKQLINEIALPDPNV